MTILGSLTNRIFAGTVLLAIVTVGFATYLVSARVTREAEAELERSLVEAGRLVEEQRTALASQHLLMARLVGDLPKLKAAVETQDALTVRPIAEEYQRQLQADLLLVTDRAGRALYGGDDRASTDQPSVGDALNGREAAAFWRHPHGILQVVSVPVSLDLDNPEILGTLSVGFLLDDRRADQFKRATASEVAFAMDGRVLGATVPAGVREQLASMSPRAGVSRVWLGPEEYAFTVLPLPLPIGATVDSGHPVAVVLRSRTSQLRSLRTINTALLATALLALVLATLLSYVVSRSVTRPLAVITATMREMSATGDLTRKITLRGPAWWQDEDTRLLASTFNTLTESIRRFQREAAQRERLLSLGRLSTVVAHEVRNPLMIIKAALRSLRPEAPAADLRESVADIDEQVNRLNRIVHDVLDFARPLRFELGVADVVDVCRSAAAGVTAGELGGPTLVVSGPSLRIVTDAERLRAALVNVLANARQAVLARDAAAGPDGPSPTTIDVTVQSLPAGAVRIAIRDRGVGVAPEHVAQIFEPYFTTRRAGTGLGLPITRNIVEGLGGTIAVTPERPGTTVTIDLPAAAPDPPAATTAPQP